MRACCRRRKDELCRSEVVTDAPVTLAPAAAASAATVAPTAAATRAAQAKWGRDVKDSWAPDVPRARARTTTSSANENNSQSERCVSTSRLG